MSTRTAGRAVADALVATGIRHAFTVPGESFLELLDALRDSPIRVIAARHEAGAGFMAEAYGQLTGTAAACLVTRAVGTANLSIALHTATADSTPLVAVAGQIPRAFRGREAFQEVDLVGSFGRLCKAAAELEDPGTMAVRMAELVRLSARGRPGPVLAALPEDALIERIGAGREAARVPPDGPPESPDPGAVRPILAMLAAARRPVVLAGAGVLRSRAVERLVAFAHAARLPVIASWRRPDVFPNESPRYLGSTGLGSPATVRERLLEADVILALGTRLSEIASFRYTVPAPRTALVHVDLEPGLRGDRRAPDLAIRSDAGAFLDVALATLAGRDAPSPGPALAARRAADLAADRAAYLAATALPAVDAAPSEGVHPALVVGALRRHMPASAIVTTDAGNFAGWAARYLPVPPGGRFLGPTSGAMGYALPAAIGAAIASRDVDGEPSRPVVALAGDGGFAMQMAELETAVRERLRLAVIVFDNAMYGTIRAHQERAHPGRAVATSLGSMDLAAFAGACGARGIRVGGAAEVEAAIGAAVSDSGVTLVHVPMDPRVLSVDRVLERAD